mmetsp:Transcript_113440/g.321032  ORF Transcript_113440/g.321032 Transcript_113440/m.321032 type:complete len:220 (+) Transcript_113440:857-1516(+)
MGKATRRTTVWITPLTCCFDSGRSSSSKRRMEVWQSRDIKRIGGPAQNVPSMPPGPRSKPGGNRDDIGHAENMSPRAPIVLAKTATKKYIKHPNPKLEKRRKAVRLPWLAKGSTSAVTATRSRSLGKQGIGCARHTPVAATACSKPSRTPSCWSPLTLPRAGTPGPSSHEAGVGEQTCAKRSRAMHGNNEATTTKSDTMPPKRSAICAECTTRAAFGPM